MLREKSTFKKSEYEYESPDGDTYMVTVFEISERKYIEISRNQQEGEPPPPPPVRWDADMIHAIDDILRKSSKPNVTFTHTSSSPANSMTPRITDFRTGTQKQSSIPVEGWNPDKIDYHENATGIGVGSVGKENSSVPDTPPEISIQGKEELLPWQLDAQNRNYNRPVADPTKKVKKVNAYDIIPGF